MYFTKNWKWKKLKWIKKKSNSKSIFTKIKNAKLKINYRVILYPTVYEFIIIYLIIYVFKFLLHLPIAISRQQMIIIDKKLLIILI